MRSLLRLRLNRHQKRQQRQNLAVLASILEVRY